jgi:hypothetical protein
MMGFAKALAILLLEPKIPIANSYGFNPRKLPNILRVVAESRDLVLRAWHDRFGNQRPLRRLHNVGRTF